MSAARGSDMTWLQRYAADIQRSTLALVSNTEISVLGSHQVLIQGDQIEVFKILNGYENIDSNIYFEIKESTITRGHNYTLVKKQSRLDVRTF